MVATPSSDPTTPGSLAPHERCERVRPRRPRTARRAARPWTRRARHARALDPLPRRDRESSGTAHAGAADAAVAPRILREVLLVIVLGVVELRRIEDFGGDRAVAS